MMEGRPLAERIRREVAEEAAELGALALATILVGADPASEIYIRHKHRAAEEAGIRPLDHRLPADAREQDVLELVEELNEDEAVDGILVQLPLPRGIDEKAVIAVIDPAKDVDGFTVANAGRLAVGEQALVPCTPLGCLMLLKDRLGDLSGLEAVIVGRSNIVGKPMAQLLLQQNCTVTIAHSRTRDLPEVVARADIVVAAAGQPQMIRDRFTKRVEELLAGAASLPEERLVQEAAVFAAKADVREELDRLRAHVDAARALLDGNAVAGRRLDFLTQEFMREANTLCSKAASGALTTVGLELKAVIEQLREQVQNVE